MQRRHKSWLTAAVLLLLVACLLAGCAGDTGNSDDMVARSDYEAVCAERDQLAAELAQATGDMVHAQLEGSFLALSLIHIYRRNNGRLLPGNGNGAETSAAPKSYKYGASLW